MCGIIGVIGRSEAAPILLDALRRLEYRGYDSAGVATLLNGHIERRRAEGRLVNLAAAVERSPIAGTTGIGHTRWATHGRATERNAHPHGTSRVSLVHNGIIENHAALRAELEAQGQEFSTETDTETVAQLVDLHLKRGMEPVAAAHAALGRLEGAYALAMVFAGHPELMVGAQGGAPLAIGYGEGEMFLGSDAIALAGLARRIAYLRDGDMAVLDRSGAVVRDRDFAVVERQAVSSQASTGLVGKAGFRHFMEKELHEHPQVIADSLHQLVDPSSGCVVLPELPFDLAAIPRATVSACGSAFYAGLTARYWFESIARLPAEADVASELRYRSPPLAQGGLAILVSQSGETADTLAALRMLKTEGQHVLSILNVEDSSIARASDVVLRTVAGPEIGVASTKAFTAQLTVLACLAIAAARARGRIDATEEQRLASCLLAVPKAASQVLADAPRIASVAKGISQARDVLFLGRGSLFPIALEGALKLKEISYIHAEGYAAGEMKHGPIALIDEAVPVVALAPLGPLFAKTASNLQEAVARGGRLVLFTDEAGASELAAIAAETIVLPTVDPFVAPILHAIAVQLLAYHAAVLRGTDLDQPRNLAKSVTVE